MIDEMHNLLKWSWRGNEVIEYIKSLETENEDLRRENERLKQIVDADASLVCASKPICKMKG